MTSCPSTPSVLACIVAATVRSLARPLASFCSVVPCGVACQHACCVNDIDVPAGECSASAGPQTMASSFSLPCCRRRMHHDCLAWFAFVVIIARSALGISSPFLQPPSWSLASTTCTFLLTSTPPLPTPRSIPSMCHPASLPHLRSGPFVASVPVALLTLSL